MTAPTDRGLCPVCESAGGTEVFATTSPVPVFCNVLHDDAGSARAATRGDIRLLVCGGCGHVWNGAHDESLVRYGTGYENSLHFSGTFQAFAEELAARLVREHDLRGGTALEIGSGKGDFLAMLCEQGVGRAVGYDPSYSGEQDGRVVDDRVTFVAALLPDDLGGLDVDLVCTRHVLEHLDRPRGVVGALRSALDPARPTAIYAEVPDGDYLLRETALWDVIYEHPSHFTRSSLHRLLDGHGLPVTRLESAFAGQYLWAEATSLAGDSVPAPDPAAVVREAERFAARAADAVDHWAGVLDRESTAGRTTAVWGTGSKGVTFLNVVAGAEGVASVVDLNPRKHGRFVPGTGQQVVGPAALVDAPPDTVVVMNPAYVDEVRRDLSALGLSPRVLPALAATAAG